MKYRRFFIWLLAVGLGTALHFLYDLWPSPISAMFAPVNESVWEHLKLLFWPMLFAGAFLAKRSGDKRKTWAGALGAVLAMPVWLLGAFYILKGGFGAEKLWVDLTLYYLTLAAGFGFVKKIENRDLPRWTFAALLSCVTVWGLLLMYFTTFPPSFPIFAV